jgi:spermidine synthase
LYFIPVVGTFETFVIFAGVLYLVAFIGLWGQVGPRALIWAWMPLVIGLASAWALNGPLRAPMIGATLLYEDESSYNYIQVQEDADGNRYLYLNEGQGIHSRYHPTRYRYDGTWDYFLIAPYFNPDTTPEDFESLLVVGSAAGTIPRQHRAVYGDVRMVGVEIDPKIVLAGALYFEMNEAAMPSLETIIEDGRYALNRLDETFSVIAIDAYRPPYIPWHLTTVEFFGEVRARLNDDGVVAINVGRTPTDRRLVDAMSRSLAEVYPSVYALDVPRSFNTLLFATKQPTEVDNLTANFAALQPSSSPLLHGILESGLGALVPVTPSDVLFTDNRAPVETISDSLVLGFLLYGDMSALGN